LPGASRAQEAGQDVATPSVPAAVAPSEDSTLMQSQRDCPVDPLPFWSRSETYTWLQICRGEWAKLATAFDDPKVATGDLDSWKPERVLSAAFLLRIMTDPAFVAATPFAGIRIQGAHFADAVTLSDLEYNKPLVIVDSVFSQLLSMERFRTRAQVRFTGDWFRYQAAAPDAPDGDNISLDLSASEFSKGLDLNWLFVNGNIDVSDMVVAPYLQMMDTSFLGEVWLTRTRVDGALFITRARLDRGLEMDAADVSKNVDLGEINLSRALPDNKTEWGVLLATQLHVGGHLIIGSSDQPMAMPGRVVGQTQPVPAFAPAGQDPAAAAQSGGDLSPAASLPAATDVAPLPATDLGPADPSVGTLAESAATPPLPELKFTVRAHQINLTSARIDGELRMRGVWLNDQISLEDAVIGDDVWLTHSEVYRVSTSAASVKGFVLLQGLRVARNAQFDSADLKSSVVMDKDTRINDLRMPGAVVKGGIYFNGANIQGAVDLDSINVGRDLALGDGSVFTGPIDLTFARIGGSLDLTGGRFNSVDLTGAAIAAELRLAAAGAVPYFDRKAELNLRNASTNSLQDVAESWPCILHLEGFTYSRQIRSVSKQRAAGAADPCAEESGATGDQQALAAATPSAPLTEKEMADAAKAAQEDRAAELVNWLARQQPFSPQPYVQLASVLRQSGDGETAKSVLFAGKEREWRGAGIWGTIVLTLQWALTGFGLYPYVSMFWVIGFIVAGTVIFGLDSSPEMRRFSWWHRAIYSFDMLIPAVHLRHHHAEIELQSWPRYYLYLHKLMGYILLSFLAAALLGLGGLE
jgi:hypothetical protein